MFHDFPALAEKRQLLIPVFVKIFAQLGGELPKLTQMGVGASNALRNDWYVIFLAAFGRGFEVHQGVPIAQPLVESDVFPPMVSQMVKIGEETGELEKMLGKIADFYEDEVDAAVQSLTSIIEPVMMIAVGCMVGVIIISMYLPMFKLLTLVK
jgi:type II secretory pathway component PulF